MLVSQKKKKTAIHTHVHTIHTYYTHMWESLRAHKSSLIARWLRILGIRTNVDDDKAPLKAHLHRATGRGERRGREYWQRHNPPLSPARWHLLQRASNCHKSSATFCLLFADFPAKLSKSRSVCACVSLCVCMWGSFIKICG